MLQCVLHGPSLVKSGSKSAKARKVNALVWGCTTVTIAMLAYAATVVSNPPFSLQLFSCLLINYSQDFFILSGEAEFSEQGAEHAPNVVLSMQ